MTGSRRPRLRIDRADWIGLIAAVPIAIGLYLLFSTGLFVSDLLAVAALVAFWAFEREVPHARSVATAVLVGIVLAFAAILVESTIQNAIDPPQWDFRWFWIHAHVATLGLDFYAPEHARLIAEGFQNTPDFLPELIYFYPPPTMLFMAPLGWFDIQTASALWGAVHLLVLLVDIVLYRRIFLPDSGYLGLALAAALIVLMRATWVTIELGQTNFLVLLAILLMWRDIRVRRAGLWLALGAAVKPIVAILGVFFVLRRRWPAVGVAVAAGLGLFALAVAVFGPDTVGSYLRSNPAANAAAWQLTQTINQSLLATVLRATGDGAAQGPFASLMILASAAVIIIVTAYVCLERDSVPDELAMGLLIPAALMLYPSSLAHYGLLLVVPLGYLIQQRRSLPWGTWLVLGTVVATYTLVGRFSFVAFVTVWGVLAALAIVSIARARRPSAPRARVR